MKKYLVTGASGFIGSHLRKRLEGKGQSVHAVSHEVLYDLETLREVVADSSPDYIIACHAYGNMRWQTEWDGMMNANVALVYNLLEAVKEVPFQGFVHVSSSSVLLKTPTMYALTKHLGEEVCTFYAKVLGKPIISVRPYAVYGEGEDDRRFIPTVFRSCFTGEAMTLSPDAVHDWVHVGDVVRGLCERAEDAVAYMGRAFPCGTGKGTTNEQVVKLIEEITGKKANITKRAQMREFDTDTWVAPVGIHTHRSLEQGLRQCYEYYKTRYEL